MMFFVLYGAMLGNLGSMSGPCWGKMAAYKDPYDAIVSLDVVGPVPDQCRAHVGQFGVYVGSFGGLYGGSMGVSGGKKYPKRRLFVWDSFRGHLKGYVGPMLGHFGSMLDPCWVIWWALLGSMEVSGGKKINPNGQACPLRFFLGVFLGDFLGKCWANVGPMLGSCWVIWWAVRCF